MRLITCDGSTLVCPFRPLRREVLQKQFSHCLSIIAENAFGLVSSLSIRHEEEVEHIFQTVATTLVEFFEERWRPVCPIHFVGVVEEGVRTRGARRVESRIKRSKIASNSFFVEVVDDETLSARSGTLHHLLRSTHVEDDDFIVCCDSQIFQWQFISLSIFRPTGKFGDVVGHVVRREKHHAGEGRCLLLLCVGARNIQHFCLSDVG